MYQVGEVKEYLTNRISLNNISIICKDMLSLYHYNKTSASYIVILKISAFLLELVLNGNTLNKNVFS